MKVNLTVKRRRKKKRKRRKVEVKKKKLKRNLLQSQRRKTLSKLISSISLFRSWKLENLLLLFRISSKRQLCLVCTAWAQISTARFWNIWRQVILLAICWQNFHLFLLQEAAKDLEKSFDVYAELTMKLCSTVNGKSDTVAMEMVQNCVELVLKEAFQRADSSGNGAILDNTLLVHMGLIKVTSFQILQNCFF